jgi:glycerol kinase
MAVSSQHELGKQQAVPSASHVIALDQGTSSTRAILFDADRKPVAQAQSELRQIYPQPGWVEHDPEEIWQASAAVLRQTLNEGGVTPADIAGIGITNQRETVVLWDRDTGKPIHNAIVWQDRRTANACATLKNAGHEPSIRAKTGLLLDPYFSATKITWLLDTVDGARAAAEQGKLAAGTMDCFVLWRLTGGAVHATDATNASRTMLFDIHRQCWDEDLCALFDIPLSLLPEVRDCAAEFGMTAGSLLGGPVAIRGIAGDQQAAAIGQACFEPGSIKSTYGTGCFVLTNTGPTALESENKLLTTVAYRLAGQTTYAIEGSIFVAGAAIQWLRDGLGLIESAAESADLFKQAAPESGVYMVPAFTGLGAPYWDSGARGAILGLTRGSGPAEIVRATIESVAYQTRDLFEAMAADGATSPATVRVDGGMAANEEFLQFLADTLDIPVERPPITETTVLGAAYLAGMQSDLYPTPSEMAGAWHCEARFDPVMDATERARRYTGWRDAVQRVRTTN